MRATANGRRGVRRLQTCLWIMLGLLAALAVGAPGADASGLGRLAGLTPTVSSRIIAMPTLGHTFVGRPGSEGTAAGQGLLPGSEPLPASDPACNPVPPASQADCNLTYHNGSVVRVNTTHLVFWAPTGYSYPAGYKDLIVRYLTDVAAASGSPENTDAVSSQYYDTVGGGQNFIQNKSTYAGSFDDTNAYPAALTGCNNQNGTICLTSAQEKSELDSFINSKSGARGLGDIWFLILPPNVQTCYDDFTWCGPYGKGTSGSGYCAYHTAFTGGFSGTNETLWANMPYDPGGSCSNQRPNNNPADDTINVLSHEMNETITDPVPSGGWVDDNTTNGGENGDQCNFQFGSSLGSTASGNYDELVNGNTYNVQMEWSNASTACAMYYGTTPSTAAFTWTAPTPLVNDPANFDGTTSRSNDQGGRILKWAWDFGDGSSGSGATVSHTYTTPGNYAVTLTVTDSANQTATVQHTVNVIQRPTQTTYTGPGSGQYNDLVHLSGHLQDGVTGQSLAGEQLTLSLGGESCQGTTDPAGNAACDVTPLEHPGQLSASAAFAGDTNDTGSSSGPQPFTLNPDETALAVATPTATHYHDAVPVSATLTDPDGGAPLAGEPVSFVLGSGGSGNTCTATTDANGTATCTLNPTLPGNQTLSASFVGDGFHTPSSGDTSFVITPEETTAKYTGPTVILAGAGPATLTGQLVEDGNNDGDGDPGAAAPNPAEPVTLSLGSQSCTGTTDPSGNVSCSISAVNQPLGPQTAGATFAGDQYYAPSSDSAAVMVFAFPSRGAFTVGDQSSATSGAAVTFWGHGWAAQNSLSGGAAPSAFKGFGGTVTLPTSSPAPAGTCKPAWVTRPGSSASPVSSVPAYMGVLQTSHVSSQGSTISGNTVHIVVVETDSGYVPNPGHPGTGKIVATFC